MSDDWVRHALDELVPTLQECAATISLVPRHETDVKFAVELGLSIMMDKPLILVVGPGVRVPAKLAKIADAIVEGDISDPAGRESLHRRVGQELTRLLG